VTHSEFLSIGRLLAVNYIALLIAVHFLDANKLAAQEADRNAPAGKKTNESAPNDELRPDGSVVDGTVVDEKGTPVAGVTVSSVFASISDIPTKTDANGKFSLKWSAVSLVLRQVKAEHPDGRQGIAIWGHGAAFRITLKRPRELAVSVVDAAGAPMTGATMAVQVGQTVPLAMTSGITDARGRWTAKFPADAVVEQVIAMKGGAGFDHFSTLTEPRGKDRRPLPDRLDLKLDGARMVRVRAVDANGQPLAGAKIIPFRIRTHEQAEAARVSDWEAAARFTDGDGMAVFDWLPANALDLISFRGYVSEHANTGAAILGQVAPDGTGADVTIHFTRRSRIMGRVTFADGRPAGNIRIQRSGFGGQDRGTSRVLTQPDGTYQVGASPKTAYVIYIEDKRWAAASQVGVMVLEGQDRRGVDFTLFEGSTVRGKITMATDRRPVANYFIGLTMRLGDVPAALRRPIGFVEQMKCGYSAVTAADGSYRLCVPPGRYELAGNVLKPITLNVMPGGEIVHDIHVPRVPLDPTNTFTRGTVVDHDNRPVEDALISGAPRSPVFMYLGFPISQNQGRFDFASTLIPLVLHARTQDGLSAGIARIENADQPPTVRLDRAATAHGRLLDAEGQIVAGQRLRYGIVVREDEADKSSASETLVVDTVTTAADGQFELRGLVPGEEFVLEYEPAFDRNRWMSLTTVKAVLPEAFDVGDLRLPAVE
jgi:hypothetical protein